MYLKRLELHGFKSFASPTAMEFGPGVTCIAGPNGAGKTNVAEAIRWVLGEQASRTMRARKTEDMIFSGSAKRAPLGMAEVRLTLDNSEGWLPVDFAEVVVARRAYRSGENEYYLNQSRVRLKDLNELFLKAQVGQNSYAFMGQGLVEQVLTLRPEERRAFIEEAADVRLHRDRLDDARNRLAGTRENLTRVELLIAEIEPRLKQLERQADRALKHADLSRELAQALQALYGQQWQEAHEALAAARAACDQRQEDFERARRDLQAVEDGAGSLSREIEDQRRDIAARDEALRQLVDAERDLQRRITVDSERVAMLTSRRDELLPEIERLRTERDGLAAVLAQHDARLQDVETSLEQARAPEDDRRALERLDARLAELRRAVADAEREAAQASSRLAEADGRRTALAQQVERLDQELAILRRELRERLAALKIWAREFAARRQKLLAAQTRAGAAAQAHDEATTRHERTAGEVARRNEELRVLNIEIGASEARLEALQGTDLELPAPDAAVRALLAAGGLIPGEEPDDADRLQGLVGMVGQLLRVPAGLERAIEAALAESLHAVVVETRDDATAAIELLLTGDLGRATVYAMDDLQASPPVALVEERGVVGVASDLVRCDHRYRPLVNALLGRTIVAQNLGIGKALLRRGFGNVVTLDGVLLKPVGSMAAGSAKAVRLVLSFQRDAGELPGELERLRAQHKELSETLEADREELAQAERERERTAPDAEQSRATLDAAEHDLRQHSAKLTSMAARLGVLHARVRDIARAAATIGPGLAEAESEVASARRRIEELEAARSRLLAETDTESAPREELAQRVTGHSARAAALEGELDALRRQRAVQEASASRIEEELDRREKLIESVERELAAVEARLQGLRREAGGKAREIESARQELEPGRHALQQVESRQHTIGAELAAARSRALDAERALLETQNAVQLRTEELDVLRARLVEEGFEMSPEGEIVPSEGPPDWLVEPQADGDAPPPMRGGTAVDVVELRDRVAQLRAGIRRLGPVNEQAGIDYAENKERYDFLSTQVADLHKAEASLLEAIAELEAIIRERFTSTFQKVNEAFRRYFESFFGGGHAELLLVKEDEEALPGIEIVAQPPRKRVRTINMLSGGERSLTAVALLFALLDTHPSPMCVLDEVDAALDEANVGRFTGALQELVERTQFIIITHNRRTLEMADTIYGVSMGDDSTSKVLSLRISDIPEKR